MTTIAREYRFESAHRLPKLPPTHRCSNLHGHNYRMMVYVNGELDERGFVMDFAELDAIVEPLIQKVDHQVLNDVPGLENPTAELIAAWFLERISVACRVRIYETDSCYAERSRSPNT